MHADTDAKSFANTMEKLEMRISDCETLIEVCKVANEKDQKAVANALTLQAREYERRLDFLNGEAGRLREMQATYLPREVYDSKHELLEASLEQIKIELNTYKGKVAGLNQGWVILLGLIALVATVIGIIEVLSK